MREGRLVGNLRAQDTNEQQVMALATGVSEGDSEQPGDNDV